MAEFSEEKWLSGSDSLCDKTRHVYHISIKVQGQYKLTADILGLSELFGGSWKILLNSWIMLTYVV